jgi:N utilization substance protein B
MNLSRSEQRAQALSLVFEKSFHDEPIPEIIELAKESREEEYSEFVENTVRGVFEHLSEIDEKISEKAKGWSISRIPRISLSIMRVAIYEMLFDDSIDVGVSINEAVQLAKKYGADKDPSFINGVLGAVARGLEK